MPFFKTGLDLGRNIIHFSKENFHIINIYGFLQKIITQHVILLTETASDNYKYVLIGRGGGPFQSSIVELICEIKLTGVNWIVPVSRATGPSMVTFTLTNVTRHYRKNYQLEKRK